MKIWAHTLVKNEERYLWYSVASVVDAVDRVLLWDSGSSDNTFEIAKKLEEAFPQKIALRKVRQENIYDFTRIRQEMLDATESDWFLVVDGDEIWWDESIRLLCETIQVKGDDIESIVVPNYILVGDVFHYQERAAGRYKLAGRMGHYNLRAVNRKIEGLKSDKPHGTWGWVDGSGKMIQDRDQSKVIYVDVPYLHASFLRRSRASNHQVPKRARKLKHEIGIPFPRDFYYPEVFFRERPEIVKPVWEKMDRGFFFRALFETPLKKIKRRVWRGSVGY